MIRELPFNESEDMRAAGYQVNQMICSFPKRRVLGVDIGIGSFLEHLERLVTYGRHRRSSYVCCVDAHMIVEAGRRADLALVVNEADFATSDGMPLTKALKWLAGVSQERIAGNDLLPAVLKEAHREKRSVYFYGGTEEVLAKIRQRLERDYPQLQIAGTESPPVRRLTDREIAETANRINHSRANSVFVSLGCPKQERWMNEMRGNVAALMLGVGAFFCCMPVSTREHRNGCEICTSSGCIG